MLLHIYKHHIGLEVVMLMNHCKPEMKVFQYRSN